MAYPFLSYDSPRPKWRSSNSPGHSSRCDRFIDAFSNMRTAECRRRLMAFEAVGRRRSNRRTKIIEETADRWAFLVKELGIKVSKWTHALTGHFREW